MRLTEQQARALDIIYNIIDLEEKYHKANIALQDIDEDMQMRLYPINSSLMGSLLVILDDILGQPHLAARVIYENEIYEHMGALLDFKKREDLTLYLETRNNK